MKKKRIILAIIIGAVLLAGGGAFVYASNQAPSATIVKTSPLAKGTLQNTVSATGVVESDSLEKISNNSTDIIERVYVSVGEWVGYGDWLCQLYNKETDTYTNIKSDTSGTITAINAIKGGLGSGELFTIEDINDLKVSGKVKEADLNLIYKNMAVAVKSDATGDQIFQGNISTIAPTAIKNDLATDQTTKNSEFKIEVNLPTESPGLKIGMTTRLTITTEEKTDVFSVPFDALVTDDLGKSCIYIAKENPDTPGSWIVESIPVTLGLETDLLIEIAGDQLIPGMAVISQPLTIQPGAAVSLEAAPEV